MRYGINEETAAFRDLMDRVRLGSEEAATEFVRQYEPAVHAAVRARFTDPALRCLLDVVDVCQKVFACFFQGSRSGRIVLKDPAHARRLLTVIARRRLAGELEKLHTRRRGGHLRRVYHVRLEGCIDPRPDPARAAAQKELFGLLLGRLSRQDRRVLQERLQGYSWDEIAARTGEKASTVRMRYARSVRRVARTFDVGP